MRNSLIKRIIGSSLEAGKDLVRMMPYLGKKIVCGSVVAGMMLGTVPSVLVLADDSVPADIPVAVQTEAPSETDVPTEATEAEPVDVNVTSVPTDEQKPEDVVVDEDDKIPVEGEVVETTVETTVAETTVETEVTTSATESTEATEVTETTVETTVPTESTTEETTTETEPTEAPVVFNVITAFSADEYYQLVSAMPDCERIIVDTYADLSYINVDCGVYFDGTYILGFDSVDKMSEAIKSISDAGYEYALDGTVGICGGVDTIVANARINPNASVKVAVIDTGSNLANEFYSVIGDDTADYNGHGTDMCATVLDETSDAYIISIKALDNDGKGNVSDVYAAIQMAEDMGVDYILLAVSIRNNGNYEAFVSLIENANATVVASAGNNGSDAGKYLPAGIPNVITVGAIEGNAEIKPFSNYGTCVEYYVYEADSTSEAAARATGRLIGGREDDLAKDAMISENRWYYEGSEYYLETNNTVDGKSYHGTLHSATKTITVLQPQDIKINPISGMTVTDSFYYYSRDYGEWARGRSMPGGCIRLAIGAYIYGATPNCACEDVGDHTFRASTGFRFDFTGTNSFMSSGGYSSANNIGLTGLSASDPVAAGNDFYKYVTTYAQPGDMIMFGYPGSSNAWRHVVIYDHAVAASSVANNTDYWYGGSARNSIVVWESTEGNPRGARRIINAADFTVTEGNKAATSAVILKAVGELPMAPQAYAGLSLDKQVASESGTHLLGAGFTVYSDAACTQAIGSLQDLDNDGIYNTYVNALSGGSEVSDRLMMPLTDSTNQVYSRTVYVKETSAPTTVKTSDGTFALNQSIVDPRVFSVAISYNAEDKQISWVVTDITNNVALYSNSATISADLTSASASLDGARVPVVNMAPVNGNEAFVDGAGIRVAKSSNNGFAVANTTFEIYAGANTYTGSPLATATYNARRDAWYWGTNEGYVKTYVVNPGSTYTIVERFTPDELVAGVPYDVVNSNGWTKISDTAYYTNVTAPSNIGAVTTVTSVNDHTGFTLTVNKRSNDGKVDGFVFDVYYLGKTTSSGTGTLVTTITTNNNGVADTGNLLLPSGYYRVVERATSDYKPTWDVSTVNSVNGSAAIVYLTTNKTISVTNEANFEFVLVHKVSSTEGNKPLSGATFMVYADTNGNGKYDEGTDKAAQAYVNGAWVATKVVETSTPGTYQVVQASDSTPVQLRSGTYFVVEEISPENYKNARLENPYVDDSIKLVIPSINDNPTKTTEEVTKDNTPDFHTTLVGVADTKVVEYTERFIVTDKVYFTNLIGGKEYTITGRLVHDVAGNPNTCTFDGTPRSNPCTQTVVFKPENAEVESSYVAIDGTTRYSGYVEVQFALNITKWAGVKIVAFEHLEPIENGDLDHYDINDLAQTIVVPEIATSVKCNTTGTNEMPANKVVSVTDTLTYKNLITDGSVQYLAKGYIYDLSKADPKNDTPVASATSATFTPSSANGSINVTFNNINTTDFDGKTFVVYEYLYAVVGGNQILVAQHVDKTDVKQTLYTPGVETQFADLSGNKELYVASDVELIDVVEFTNLDPNATYVVSGKIVNVTESKKTGSTVYFTNDAVSVTFKPNPTSPSNCECQLDANGRAYGTVRVTFHIDASDLQGETLVAFETLTNSGVEVGLHAEIDDYPQSVFFPKIGTTLVDRTTATHVTVYGTQTSIVDTVAYENVLPGEYTLSGVLMNKATNEAILNADGSKVVAQATFTVPVGEKDADGNALPVSGSQDVEFIVDTTAIKGVTAVAYEYLYVGANTSGRKVADHEDINDVDQTVYIPDVATSVKCNTTGTNEMPADKVVDVTDTLTYSNLFVNDDVKYVAKGFIYDITAANPATDTAIATAESETFAPTAANGTVDVVFKDINTTDFDSKTFVVYEYLYAVIGGTEHLVAQHVDKTDVKQTLYTPGLETQFGDVDADKVLYAAKDLDLVDVVEFTNLDPNATYVVSGKLVNVTESKKTGSTVYFNNEEVSVTFQPKATDPVNCECTIDENNRANGTVRVTFHIDASALQGQTLVAFEDLKNDGVEVALHADIDDFAQTVFFPEIGTTLIDRTTADHITAVAEEAKLVDTVEYKNVLPGEYTMYGVLMNKETGLPVLNADNTEVTGKTTFTVPEGEKDAEGNALPVSGSVEVEFTLDTSVIKGITAVAYEYLYVGADITGKLVEDHTDIDDVDQTIEIPEIKTTLVDAITDTHTATFAKEVKLVDHVAYTHLIPGREYVMSGVLMDAETGLPIKDAKGNEIVGSQKFTPETADGIVDVEFTLDTTVLVNVTRKIVAFETCSEEGKDYAFAIHADLTDKDQTVGVPTLITNAAFADGSKRNLLDDTHYTYTLVDTLTYTDLAPEREYLIKTTLMVKYGDGSYGVLKGTDGKDYVVETIVKTDKAAEGENTVNGTFTVTMEFSAKGLNPDKDAIVVYEDIYDVVRETSIDTLTGNETTKVVVTAQVAEHHDINDKDQTVDFWQPKTGDTPVAFAYLAGLVASVVALVGTVIFIKRRKRLGEN